MVRLRRYKKVQLLEEKIKLEALKEKELIELVMEQKKIEGKIETLEDIGDREKANQLRIEILLHLVTKFKECKNERNKKVILELLIQWIESQVSKIIQTETKTISLNAPIRELSEP